MRMFLSVSGHSSEPSIANHSPRSTVLQLNCVSDTISSWFENHQPQKTKISSVILERGATLESGLTVARFFSTNHNSLLHIATNEIASFWKDQRSRQMAFFLVQRWGKGGAKGRLSRYVEIFWNKKRFSLLYKTNRPHVAVRLIQ